MRDFVLHQNKMSGPAFVAHRADEVIGWCDIRRHALPAFAHRGQSGWGLWRSGAGAESAFGCSTRRWTPPSGRGLPEFELAVRTDNARAIALYDKIGFVREGLLRDSFFIDGEYFDAIAMAIIRRP